MTPDEVREVLELPGELGGHLPDADLLAGDGVGLVEVCAGRGAGGFWKKWARPVHRRRRPPPRPPSSPCPPRPPPRSLSWSSLTPRA